MHNIILHYMDLETAHQDINKNFKLSTLKQLKSLYFMILTNSEQKNRLSTVSKKDIFNLDIFKLPHFQKGHLCTLFTPKWCILPHSTLKTY